ADIGARIDAGAALADNDVAADHFLAAKLLHAEATTGRIATVARATACFFMCHLELPLTSWQPAFWPGPSWPQAFQPRPSSWASRRKLPSWPPASQRPFSELPWPRQPWARPWPEPLPSAPSSELRQP